MRPNVVRPVAGIATVVVITGIVVVAFTMFRGGFAGTVPVTVLSPRAGLVMNPDAKVKLHGVQVGKVSSIDAMPDGQAALHLAIDPAQLHLIPSNTLVDVTSSTVFGSKFVELVAPADPSPQPLHAGQVLNSNHVTVEINTVFQQLTAVLSAIEPAKLNETLGAIAAAFNGRGEKFGGALANLDTLLTKIDPSLSSLNHDLELAPQVFNAYADAAPDLSKTADAAAQVSQTFVDEQHNLDALLVSAIGLADVGNDVLGTNRRAFTDVVHLLLPTTDLTNQYNQALKCGISAVVPLAKAPPLPVPGALVTFGFTLGVERYRYPSNLPKVSAKGGPPCTDLPSVPFEKRPPFLVADVGANPWQYGNQGILLNSDGLKQLLFGPIDGPPRNSTQIGQPG